MRGFVNVLESPGASVCFQRDLRRLQEVSGRCEEVGATWKDAQAVRFWIQASAQVTR